MQQPIGRTLTKALPPDQISRCFLGRRDSLLPFRHASIAWRIASERKVTPQLSVKRIVNSAHYSVTALCRRPPSPPGSVFIEVGVL
jgi:hypothetical protein